MEHSNPHPGAISATELGARLRAVLARSLGIVDEHVATELASCSTWVELRRGELLFREGDPGDAWYVVAAGRLEVRRGGPEHAAQRVGEAAAGASLGEMALLDGAARTATVVATRASRLIRVARADFERIVLKSPAALLAVSRTLVGRLRGSLTRAAVPHCTHVALLNAGGPATRELAAALARALNDLGPVFRVAAEGAIEPVDLRPPRLPVEHPDWLRFAFTLEERAPADGFLLLEATPGDAAWAAFALEQADRVVIVCDADAAPRPSLDERRLLAQHGHADLALVLVYRAGMRPSGTAQWRSERGLRRHFHVREGCAGDLARLARSLAGRAIGLALGGGGARGFAHLGIARALREAGVPIDLVGGTSMGALMGALIAMDTDHHDWLDMARRLTRRAPFGDYTVPVMALLKSERLAQVQRDMFGDIEIEDLWLDYFAVAADLSTASLVIKDSGLLRHATLASSSLPGACLPVIDGGHLLADGGIVDNLPAGRVKARGGGPVIAVNVTPERDLTVRRKRFPTSWQVLWDRIQGGPRYPDVPSALRILLRSTMLSSAASTAEAAATADLFFSPPVADFDLLDLRPAEQIIEVGYRYAAELLARSPPRFC